MPSCRHEVVSNLRSHKLEIYSGDNLLLAPLTLRASPALGRGEPMSNMLRTQEHRSILSEIGRLLLVLARL
jgi:hypothetical protein